MFELTLKEFENLRSQIVISSYAWGGIRYLPMAFTEQGVTMRSCILNSERAIAVNIRVIRIFTKMREMLSTNKDILMQLQKLEKRIDSHDEKIAAIFECLKQLLKRPQPLRTRIGFRRRGEKD